jgi:hypothetical protein
MYNLNLILLLLNFLSFSSSCDIFIASKCPPAPSVIEVTHNYTLYCDNTKEHVDCMNNKMKSCKRVQEFGPALETIKISMNVIIDQVRHH